MNKVNVGGERLGSGAKMNVSMHGFERSTHDLSYLWKSTMAPGTLIPFMNLVALPGDTFDIELDANVKTNPTIGPLFGSFKLQLDVFSIPMRLYNRQLHNNKLGIGMDMVKVKFPIMELLGKPIDAERKTPPEFQQINQSSLLAYLGIRGIAGGEGLNGLVVEQFNAMPFLAYWDIYKNYYINKQEPYAYIIHGTLPTLAAIPTSPAFGIGLRIEKNSVQIVADDTHAPFFIFGKGVRSGNIELRINATDWINLETIANRYEMGKALLGNDDVLRVKEFKDEYIGLIILDIRLDDDASLSDQKPELYPFDPEGIDIMREYILSAPNIEPFNINMNYQFDPYKLIFETTMLGDMMSAVIGQEGLAIKTYQSDIFNNWLSQENFTAITNVTAIDTSTGSFSMDTLNLTKKVYDLLNRIAVSGGSYEDWLTAVYDNKSKWRAETPVYQGGLSKEIVFEQVVSQSATEDEPLGSLGGRGTMTNKHKGGKMIINIDEPSYIMGIVSITPRIDYSQGNSWDVHLGSMDDLHKPSLDGIGFQELITDQMAFWDTINDGASNTFRKAGYVPAWINYMTNHNKTYGNFADERSMMFMTLNRRYSIFDAGGIITIKDLTSYIDPSKFNYAFAQTDLGAQNFWTQLGCNITARRKMSAKIIPNL